MDTDGKAIVFSSESVCIRVYPRLFCGASGVAVLEELR